MIKRIPSEPRLWLEEDDSTGEKTLVTLITFPGGVYEHRLRVSGPTCRRLRDYLEGCDPCPVEGCTAIDGSTEGHSHG